VGRDYSLRHHSRFSWRDLITRPREQGPDTNQRARAERKSHPKNRQLGFYALGAWVATDQGRQEDNGSDEGLRRWAGEKAQVAIAHVSVFYGPSQIPAGVVSANPTRAKPMW